jgi:Gas vesicle protein
MAKKPSTLDDPDSSLLDIVDTVLNRGVALRGDVVLGLANVDLIYARLSVLLAALDRITSDPALPPVAAGRRKRRTASRRRRRSRH